MNITRRTALQGVVATALTPNTTLAEDSTLYAAIAEFRRQADLSEQVYADLAKLSDRVELAHPEVTRHFQIMRALADDQTLSHEEIRATADAENERGKPFLAAYHRDLKAAGYDEDKGQHVHARRWELQQAVLTTPANTIGGLLAKVEVVSGAAHVVEDGLETDEWAVIVSDIRRLAGASC